MVRQVATEGVQALGRPAQETQWPRRARRRWPRGPRAAREVGHLLAGSRRAMPNMHTAAAAPTRRAGDPGVTDGVADRARGRRPVAAVWCELRRNTSSSESSRLSSSTTSHADSHVEQRADVPCTAQLTMIALTVGVGHTPGSRRARRHPRWSPHDRLDTVHAHGPQLLHATRPGAGGRRGSARSGADQLHLGQHVRGQQHRGARARPPPATSRGTPAA